MGIRYFKTYCHDNHCETKFKLFERSNYIYNKNKKNTVIIIDASSFIFEIFKRFNHNFQLVQEYFQRIKQVCEKNHLELIFISELSTREKVQL